MLDLPSIGALIAQHKLFIATLVGTLIGAVFRKKHTTFELTLSVGGGLATSYYLSPIIVVLTNGQYLELIGFVLGLVGMNVISSVITLSEHISKNIVVISHKWIYRRSNIEIVPANKDDITEPLYTGPERRVEDKNPSPRRRITDEEFDDLDLRR